MARLTAPQSSALHSPLSVVRPARDVARYGPHLLAGRQPNNGSELEVMPAQTYYFRSTAAGRVLRTSSETKG
jgi:hypothetical protein